MNTPIEIKETLDDLVPDPEIAERYIGREIHGREDFEVFDYARESGTNILMAGPTGSAKTTAAMAYASARRIPFVSIACHTAVEPSLWKGTMSVDEHGRWDFAPTALLIALRYSESVIVFDEVDRAPHGISAAIHSLTDGRRNIDVEEAAGSSWPTLIKAHPGTLIIGAYNRGYLGHVPLDEAFRNRWPLAIDWGYSDEVESKLVHSESLRELASKLRAGHAEGVYVTPCSTNRLIEFEELAYSPLGFGFAVANFLELFLPEERRSVNDLLELHKDGIMTDLFRLPDDEEAA